MQDTALLEQLTDDIGIARQLLELINQEFTALGERNLAELEAILAKKQPLLALLGQHGTQRSQWLAGLQLTPDRRTVRLSLSERYRWRQSLSAAVAPMKEMAVSSEPIKAPLAECCTFSKARTIHLACMTIVAVPPRTSRNGL